MPRCASALRCATTRRRAGVAPGPRQQQQQQEAACHFRAVGGRRGVCDGHPLQPHGPMATGQLGLGDIVPGGGGGGWYRPTGAAGLAVALAPAHGSPAAATAAAAGWCGAARSARRAALERSRAADVHGAGAEPRRCRLIVPQPCMAPFRACAASPRVGPASIWRSVALRPRCLAAAPLPRCTRPPPPAGRTHAHPPPADAAEGDDLLAGPLRRGRHQL